MSTESAGPLSVGLPSADPLGAHPARDAGIVAELRRLVASDVSKGPAAERLVELTESLFPGPIRLEQSCDPDEPDNQFTVLTVGFTGSPQEAVLRREMWHVQAAAVLGHRIGALRLSIVPAAPLPAASG